MIQVSTRSRLIAVIVLALGTASAVAQSNKNIDLTAKDTRTFAQKEQDRNSAEARKGYEHTQREKDAEKYRDTRHDGRLKTGKDSSVGAGIDPPNVNWRTTTK